MKSKILFILSVFLFGFFAAACDGDDAGSADAAIADPFYAFVTLDGPEDATAAAVCALVRVDHELAGRAIQESFLAPGCNPDGSAVAGATCEAYQAGSVLRVPSTSGIIGVSCAHASGELVPWAYHVRISAHSG